MNENEHDSRLEEVAAYAIGGLDPDRLDELERHLTGCKRCQDELRWLAPAVQALPEAVERQEPSPELKVRLMADVRLDVAADVKRAKVEERRERAASRGSFGEWLRGLHIGGLTYKPLAGAALAILVIAAGVGYGIGSGGGSGGAHTTEVPVAANGIAAKVVQEDNRGELHLTGVQQLPEGKVLEAWVQRGNAVEPVAALFTPDHAGNASTTIDNMKNVSAILVTREPSGGTKVPTTEPIVKVPIES